MEDFYVSEIMYYTSDEFSDRIISGDGVVQKVTWEELNTKYNFEVYNPVDGRLVRICDHLSALMEADISIKHGITSTHLTNGREGLLNHYKPGEVISGVNVNRFFNAVVY